MAEDTPERGNLREIEALNQRGGRTLSIVDVMRAGTIPPEAAGFLLWRVAHGASFLTGAVPGGAGKSTLLADLLAMLPPGERIVTTPDEPAVSRALRERPRSGRCYLCHEIGSGHWYGYLWGSTVGRFLGLQEAARVQVRLKPRQGGLLERVNVTKIPWLSVELEVTAESAE